MAGKANGRGRAVQTILPGVQAPPIAAPLDAGELELEPFERTLRALRDELGDELELKLKVWRVEGKQKTYCDAYPIDAIESDEAFQEKIRADWGGGVFRIVCHDGTGFRINREIRIAERPNRQAPAADATAAAIARLEQQIANLQAPRESETQWLEKLKLYRDVLLPNGGNLAPRESPAKMIGELLAVMQGAKELRAAMPGGDDAADSEPSVYQLGSQLLSLIQGVVMKQPHQVAAPTLPGVVAPPAIAAPASSSASDPAQPGGDQGAPVASDQDQAAAIALRQAVTGLNALASFNADTASAADMVFEKAPDEVLEMLERSDWWARLVELAPAVAQFEPWYRAVHVELMTLWAKEKKRVKAPAPGAGGQAADQAKR